ncbi:alpha/beta hydrolase [Alkalicoccus chagannorensis]
MLAGVLLLLIYWFQDRLVFFPSTIDETQGDQTASVQEDAERVSYVMEDGTTVAGWKLNRSDERLLIYYGGNGQELSGQVRDMDDFDDWSVLLVNYRGYGLSEGDPGEDVLYSDALEVYDQVAEEYCETAVIGRSIGTAVAANTAVERDVDQMVLISPFDSLAAVGSEAYPFLPVETLLRFEFDTASRIQGWDGPLMVVYGEDDAIVQPERTRALLEAWDGEADEVRSMPGRGHNDLQLEPDFYSAMADFLRERSTTME